MRYVLGPSRKLKYDLGRSDQAELISCDALDRYRIFPKMLHPSPQLLNLSAQVGVLPLYLRKLV